MITVAISLPNDQGPDERKSLIEQIYYLHPAIERAEFRDGKLMLDLGDGGPSAKDLEGEVLKLSATNAKAFRNAEQKILFEVDGTREAGVDPFPILAESRQVCESRTRGVHTYTGDFLRAMRGLDQLISAHAQTQNAEHVDVPTTVPLESLLRAGYVGSFPQHALFAAPIREDLKAIERVAAAAKSPGSATPQIAQDLSLPTQVLSPTVCYHCFEALRNGTMSPGGRVLTALGKCHRHEHKTTVGIERLQTFTMRELIYFGRGEWVKDRIGETLNWTYGLFTEWGLKSRIVTASDPFFAIESSKKRTFQVLWGLKQELQVWLPHSGKWLAAGSFNNHRSTLVEPFAIKSDDGATPLESGCVGYGFERLIFGVMSQFGVAPAAWPDNVRRSLALATTN